MMALLFLPFSSQGQRTLVHGRVSDAISKSPIAFANVYFTGTQIGIFTDEVGNFILESDEQHRRVTVSALGFRDTTINLESVQKVEIRIFLEPADYTLDEIVVRAGENPAYPIIRKVISAKEKLQPGNLDHYSYHSYNKTQFDLNNFTDAIKKNLLFRPFPFIWQFQDSMANGVRYLPFLFKENIRHHYYRKKPTDYKEYVIGHQTAQFFRGPKIEQFIQELAFQPNLYDNFVVILQKIFPSPVNDNFQRYYRYRLNDTIAIVDGHPCHRIRFFPKIANDVAFIGEMWIDTSSYAIVQAEMNFAIEANINFLRSFWIRIKSQPVNGNTWMVTETTVLADFTVVENSAEMTGFFGRRNSVYSNFRINESAPDSIFFPLERVIELEDFEKKDEAFWNINRKSSLSKQEADIFYLVDTIQSNWKFKLIKNTFMALGSGYIPYRGIEIGNVLTFFSYNDVEHSRVKVGFRTPRISEFNFRPAGYLAYGFKDQRWKYKAQVDYMLQRDRNTHTMIGGLIRRDVEQLGMGADAFVIDHVMTSFIQFAQLNARTFITQQEVYAERQWFRGFVTRLFWQNRDVAPFGPYQFTETSTDGTRNVGRFRMTGIGISGRYATGDRYVSAQYNLVDVFYFMTRRPVVSWEYIFNDRKIFGSEFDRHNVNVRVEHDQKLKRWGYLSYVVEAGKVWGKVPFPFLAIPVGNQSLFADYMSFNMMNFMEFVADEYVSVMAEQHFEGLLFNHLPFNKWLKWREFVFAKMYWGHLSHPESLSRWSGPPSLHTLREPYVELGFGIENIFKLGRVDFTWRLNYHNNPDVYRFLPKPSFQLRF